MKKVSILLTKYTDLLFCLVYCVTGRGYTHVSLGLEEEDESYQQLTELDSFCGLRQVIPNVV